MSLLSLPAPEDSTSGPPAAPLDPALQRQMREELSRLLDQVPSARRVFPALWVVERTLRARRPGALDLLPVAAIRTAAKQLDQLGRTAQGDVLRTLGDRLRMLGADPAERDDADIGTFEPGRNVDAHDITLTQFMEVDKEVRLPWHPRGGLSDR